MVNNNVVLTMTLLETVKVRQTATTGTYTEQFFLKQPSVETLLKLVLTAIESAT